MARFLRFGDVNLNLDLLRAFNLRGDGTLVLSLAVGQAFYQGEKARSIYEQILSAAQPIEMEVPADFKFVHDDPAKPRE